MNLQVMWSLVMKVFRFLSRICSRGRETHVVDLAHFQDGSCDLPTEAEEEPVQESSGYTSL